MAPEGGCQGGARRCVGGVGRRIQGDRGIECTYLVLSRASIVEERVEGARRERAERSLRGEDRRGELGEQHARVRARKKRSDVFSEFRVVRATASAAMRERQRESGEGMGRYAGEDTHLGEERLRDVDVAEVDGGENLGAMEKETKRRQSIGSSGCRRRTRACVFEIADTG